MFGGKRACCRRKGGTTQPAFRGEDPREADAHSAASRPDTMGPECATKIMVVGRKPMNRFNTVPPFLPVLSVLQGTSASSLSCHFHLHLSPRSLARTRAPVSVPILSQFTAYQCPSPFIRASISPFSGRCISPASYCALFSEFFSPRPPRLAEPGPAPGDFVLATS